MRLLAEQLDRRLAPLRTVTADLKRLPSGWIRVVRAALGMTSAQLAKRMGLSQSRIVEMEMGEIEGSLTRRSLERAADALGCQVVYFFVPRSPLSETIEEQAARVTDQKLSLLATTMTLEDQTVAVGGRAWAAERRRLIDNPLANRGTIWRASRLAL